MKKNFLIAMMAVMAVMTSCDDIVDTRTPRSVGGSGEVLFVTQNDSQWEGLMGQTVRDFFGEFQYGLPQPEPMFKVAHLNVNGFSDMFKKHRNLLIGEINPESEKTKIEIQEEWTAAPQHVMKITAPTEEAWKLAFETQKDELLLKFEENERVRFLSFFRPSADKKLMSLVNKKFNVSMVIPEGYYAAVEGDGFLWLRKELDNMSYGFFIYERPYTDTAEFSPRRMAYVRDSVLMRYVPGPVDSSYMSTDKRFVVPTYKALPDFPAGYAVEMRGVWNVVNDFMAGPFISYTIVNPEQTKLITAEGFIYYPNKDKRDYLRQMEAILWTLKFKEDSI